MHKCLNCGKEFDGKFCPECGTKWIDPDLCPKCGAHHEPDAKFCPECGIRLDGKVSCPKCGAAVEPNVAFCAECGASLNGNGAAKEIAVTGEVDKKAKIKSYIALGGIICIILSALIGLIFTFCTGVTGVTSSDGTISKSTNMLYYYFGDAYKNLDSLRDFLETAYRMESIGEVRELALYLPVVAGTAISALGILGVVCLSALTAHRAYKKFYKKEEANVIAPAVATYLIFATVATVLLALTACKVEYKYSEYSLRREYTKAVFSDPTLAGLIMGGILLGLGVLLLTAVNCKLKDLKSIGAITAVVGSALAVVILSLAALPAAGLKASESYTTTKCLYSPFMIMGGMVLRIEDEDDLGKIVAFASVTGIAGIALAISAATTLYKKIPAVLEGRHEKSRSCGVYIVVLAVLYLAFAILTNNAVIDASLNLYGLSAEEAEEIKSMIDTSYTVPIAILVMAVLAFVAEIAGRLAHKKEGLYTISE